jgi:cytochrome c oxidase subunit IV
MSTAAVPVRVYLRTGAALLVLLALTVGVSQFHLGRLNILITLLIAVVKAALVALFFMHLRYRSSVMRLFAVSGLVWLTIMIALTLSDFLHRGWMGLGP